MPCIRMECLSSSVRNASLVSELKFAFREVSREKTSFERSLLLSSALGVAIVFVKRWGVGVMIAALEGCAFAKLSLCGVVFGVARPCSILLVSLGRSFPGVERSSVLAAFRGVLGGVA